MDINEILTHLGEERSNYFNAVAPPIMQSSNFAFDNIDDFRKSISDEFAHHIYTRGNNPTVEILRKKIAALEHCEEALVVSSGAAAVAIAVISQVSQGDHVICVNKPYSWTHKLISKLLHRFGVEYSFVDATDSQQIFDHCKSNTKVIYLESPNTFTFELQDLEVCATFAKARGITTIIDNSHCSPIFQNPADFGIDIIVHSATKYLCGHSDVVMGVICGSKLHIQQMFLSEFMTLGVNVSPNDAFLAIRGLRTLLIRLERIESTTQTIVKFLCQHPKIRKVYYPMLEDNPQLALANKQMRGCGGLVSIELNTEDRTEVHQFIERLDKFLLAVSWGGYESLKMPTLAFYDLPGLPNPALPWQMVRLYIGLEDSAFLIHNIEHALEAIKA